MDSMIQSKRMAARAGSMLQSLTTDITEKKREFEAVTYWKRYTKHSLKDLPNLSRSQADNAIHDMELAGYVFPKISSGSTEKYNLTIRDVSNLYEYRGVAKYRDNRRGGFVVFVTNLKGGVSKTVSIANLAHGFRAHDNLLKEDIRILVVDLDPQASATMFNDETLAIGQIDNSSAQAILQNVSLNELKNNFIKKTGMDGVDILPASIEDAFIASDWLDICAENWPNKNPYELLQKNLIDKLRDDYDFILLDTGPHLDALLLNSLACADLLMTPVPPAQVDFHSTLKYLERLPILLEQLVESGIEPHYLANIGYMTKMTKNKSDHKAAQRWAKEVFGADFLDVSLPKLDGFERVGESFNTAISASPKFYDGSTTALKFAREAAFDFAYSAFEQIETLRQMNLELE